ncbi:MAG: hypothetical protein Unbinned1953contig1002_2 [Prokaryotic dsDNA virus sp.]|nr:MAG: hypothetical protein Unbinned1953contig1002_2 [Prokaryotic dsDNA virus sp.]|tara:strand:- start:1722 stop:2087 length:366 start_codon:yes stop_codon:yes gene_type:complete
MLYIKKAVTNTLKVALADKVNASITQYKIVLTNDVKTLDQELVIVPTFTNRYAQFNIVEPSNITLTDEGSYTYQIKGDDVTLARGKAIVYDGTFTTATKFGDEVTYTEHTNTETNTQYITI